MTLRRAFGAFAGGVAMGLALVSCGERSLGTGVVLWSDGGPMATGAIVDVVEESTIEDRYLVRAAAADRREEPLPVAPRWRVRVFAEPEQAAEFAARFAEFVDVYAYAVRRGLPVRAEASATAGIVYKLREQEVTKVIERGAEPEQVGSFENYWYRVLTEDGTEGYTFGEFLPVFESFGDPRAEAARLQADDPGLERALATAWRPEEFLSMVNRRRFDLLRLRPEYGLFPDPEAGVFRLVTEQREREFPYRAVERVGDGRYVLATGGDGSAARFTLRGNGALAFSYVDEGRLVTEVFVDLQQEVEELIAGERGRRERLFAALLERGPLLRSGGYGTIELTEEGRFRWQGYGALVPRWVPDGLPGTGVVDFRYALGAPLRGGYDTVVTLLFDSRARAARSEAPRSAPPVAGAVGAAPAGPGTAAAAGAAAAGAGTEAGGAGAGRSGSGVAGADAGAALGGAGAGEAGAGAVAVAEAGGAGAGRSGSGVASADAGTAPGDTGVGEAAAGAGGAGNGVVRPGSAGSGADTADAGRERTGTASGPGGDAGAAGAVGAAPGGTGAGDAGTAGTAAAVALRGAGEETGGAAGSEPEEPDVPEYMRAIPWAAELTLLVSYDGAGVRLTPAEPAAAGLEVRQVNRSAVVMYFGVVERGRRLMVTLTEIAVAYGEQVVLDDISLTIDRGARIALCGANGSGKSTLMRVIAGQASADSGRVIAKRGVSIAYLAQSGVEHGGRTLREELTLAFTRELAAEEELRRIEEQMADTGVGGRNSADAGELDRLLARYGELGEQVSPDGAADRAARLDRVSRGLGFGSGDMDQDTATFSSGWQMRIALAKLLLESSDLLLLDEPSNYLDLEARQWLEQYLRSYRGGYLLVAHDRMLMDRTCDQVAEIYRGKLRLFSGSFSRYLVRREAELEQMADAYERQQEEIARMEAFVRKFRANSSKARLVQSRIKQLDRLVRLQPPPVQSHIAFSFPAAPKGGRRALSASGLRLSYGEHEVIRDLDLELDRGDRLALVGENGVGKSTLMRALAGAAPVTGGRVTLGTGVTTGYYAQDRAEQLTGSGSVLEFMEAVAPTEMVPRVRNLLGAFLFSGDEVFKPLSVLSGGERSRVALVRLLLEPANLLLLDEPTSHLDLSAISVLTQALRSYAGTLLFASHDEYFIEQLATKVLEVTRDRVRLYHGGWDYYAWKHSGAAAPAAAGGSPDSAVPGGATAGPASSASSAAAAASAAEVAELAAFGAGDRGRGSPRPRGKGRRRAGTARAPASASASAVAGSRRGKGGKRGQGRHRRQDTGAAAQRRQQELLEELDRLQHDEQRLQAELSDPAVYTDGARVRDLKRRLAANSRAQQQTTTAWEETEG